jgi:hypothetical protein
MTGDDLNQLFPARSDSLAAPLPLVLTVEQAAERLGVGRTVMYALSAPALLSPSRSAGCDGYPPTPWSPSWTSFEPGAEGVRRDTPSQWTLNDLSGKRWLLARSGDSWRHRSREGGSTTCHVTIQVRRHCQGAGAREETGERERPPTRWTVAGWLEHWLENIA